MKFTQKLAYLVENENQSAICRRAGLPPTAIANYLCRGQVPNAVTGLRLARALGVSPLWLYDDEAELPVEWSDPAKTLSEIVTRLPLEKVAELTNAARVMAGTHAIAA